MTLPAESVRSDIEVCEEKVGSARGDCGLLEVVKVCVELMNGCVK